MVQVARDSARVRRIINLKRLMVSWLHNRWAFASRSASFPSWKRDWPIQTILRFDWQSSGLVASIQRKQSVQRIRGVNVVNSLHRQLVWQVLGGNARPIKGSTLLESIRAPQYQRSYASPVLLRAPITRSKHGLFTFHRAMKDFWSRAPISMDMRNMHCANII